MLGPIFVYGLLLSICVAALARPYVGIIGFYGFLLLDPTWNWRWSLATGMQYQKYIFIATCIGFIVCGMRAMPQSRISRIGLVALLGFWIMCLVSTQQSVSPVYSERFMGVLWKELLVVALGMLLLDRPSRVKALLVVAVLAQAYNAYQINLDYFATGFSRYAYSKWGTSGADNNGYSIITVPIMAISFCLALFEQKFRWRALFLTAGMLQVHQIMLMQSRGCMLAAIPMLGLIGWKMPRSSKNIRLALASVVLGSLLAGPSVVDEFVSSFSSGEERDSSASSRFLLWKAGWRITMDHPVTGVGPNAARVLVPKPEYYDGGLETDNKALHNLFFDVSTGAGIPGFIAYFSFLCLPIVYCWRTYQSTDNETGAARLSVFAGLFGYLLASMFSSGLLFESCYILLVAGYCISNIDRSRQGSAALLNPSELNRLQTAS